MSIARQDFLAESDLAHFSGRSVLQDATRLLETTCCAMTVIRRMTALRTVRGLEFVLVLSGHRVQLLGHIERAEPVVVDVLEVSQEALNISGMIQQDAIRLAGLG